MQMMMTLAASGPDPVGHVANHWFIKSGDWVLWSAIQSNLVVTTLIMVFLGMWIARRIATGSPDEGHDRFVTRNPLAHMVEVICTYLREETVRPLLRGRTDRYMPYLWTLFFFILINNLLGLLPMLDIVTLIAPDKVINDHWSPIGGTATQSIYITGVLAIMAGIVINVAGVKELGIGGYLKHLTAGAPVILWPMMILIETAGTFIKPAALAIRLFANMTAGHILMATLFAFVEMGLNKGLLVGVPVGIASFLGSLAVYGLEIFVSFLQAFVFMFLTTVFISLLSHQGDEAHDSHESTDHADTASVAIAA